MKAIVLKDFGSVDQLQYQDLVVPAIHEGEVLIRAKAIGINPVDAKTRKGKGQAARIKDQHPMILGWDVAGEVVETRSPLFAKGDAVFGMINIPGHGKAYAEYVAAPAVQLALKPANISFEEAAAAGIAAMTAWQAVVTHGKVQAGQTVLIQAAAGGVGHYAVQIASYYGAHVTGSSSGVNKDFVLGLGAEQHLDYTIDGWENGGETFDFILEGIGGDNIDKSLKLLKPGGTIVSLPSGLSEDVGDKAAAQGKHGIFFMVKINKEDLEQIALLLASGSLRSYVSEIFSFDEIKMAHEHIESGKTKGKIVLKV